MEKVTGIPNMNSPNLQKELHMPRVQHFEISANDPEKLAAFYEKVFGWKITKWECN